MDYKNIPTKQTGDHLEDKRFTIKVSAELNRGTDKPPKEIVVFAPLIETFGFTVGSEFTAPFDANFVSGAMQKTFALANVSQKLGASTRKMYSNPEPTEISFDMQFEAYADPFNDVFVPVVYMMALAIGRRMDLPDVGRVIDETISKLSNAVGRTQDAPSAEEFFAQEGNEYIDQAGRVFGFLNFVAGPPIARIRFGNVITFKNAYITSVAPQFSNIMDKNGIPMSATVSVTAILEEDPTINDENFSDFFDRGLG